MPSRALPPSSPVLPVSRRTRHRLDRVAAALDHPSQRTAIRNAGWLPAPAAQALAMADDPEYRYLLAAYRAREAPPGDGAPRPAPPPGAAALLTRLARRYPQAWAALRAGLAEAGSGASHDVITLVIVPGTVIYIVLVPGCAWNEPGLALLEDLVRLGEPAPGGPPAAAPGPCRDPGPAPGA